MNIQDFIPISEPVPTGAIFHYFAQEAETGQRVIVEILPNAGQNPLFSAEQFEQIAQKLINFHHPSVLEVLAYGWEGSNVYVVKRILAGRSLVEKLRSSGQLFIQETTAIFERICPAMTAAHEQGILHQDIRLENIFLDQDGKIYLTNFGVAGFSNTSLAYTGQPVVGNPKILSPEQTTRQRIDSRSDVYQLGLLLYQLLAGSLPFEAQSGLGYVIQNILDKAPSLKYSVRRLPRGMEGLLYRSLEKEPEHRIQTPDEFLDILQKVVVGKPPTVLQLYEKQITAPFRKETRANQFRSALRWGKRSLIAFIAMALLWWIGVNLHVLAKPQNELLASLIIPSRTPTSTPTFTPTLSPSGIPSPLPTLVPSNTLIPSPFPTSTSTPTYTPSPTTTTTPLPLAMGGADKIAFVSNNNIWIVNIDGTGLEQVTFDSVVKFDLQWMSDRVTIKYLTPECVFAVNIDTKTSDRIECNQDRAYEISPDGRKVAVSIRDDFRLYTIGSNYSKGSQQCTYRFEDAGEIRWPDRGDLIAVVGKTSQGGIQVNVVRILDLSICSDPRIADEFPGLRFSMRGYDKEPVIQDFDWDGVRRFILIGPQRNDGFGFMYVYDYITGNAQAVDPLGKNCCYRDVRWSPDGDYILFAFQDILGGENSKTQLYYINFGTIGQGLQYTPIDLPETFFPDRRAKPQPALRTAP